MKGIHYVAGAVILIIGVLVAYILVPGDEELALISLKDKEFDTALLYYEQRLNDGDLVGSVVIPLSELYLQYGDVESAIAVMERFVDQEPDNLEARRILGRYYQYGQRAFDYTVNLEQITEVDPTDESLRELADIYNFRSEFEMQAATLERLIALTPDNPDDFISLAWLEASREQLPEAVAALDGLRARHPASVTIQLERLRANLLLDLQNPDGALDVVSSVFERSDFLASEAVTLVAPFNVRGFPRHALRALDLLEPVVDRDPDLLSQWVEAHFVLGNLSEAAARLELANDAGPLALELERSLIDLLLALGRFSDAIVRAESGPLDRLSELQLESLVQVAIELPDAAFARRLLGNAPALFFENRPLRGAEMALLASDSQQFDRWLDVAEGVPSPTLEERVALASLYIRTGRRPGAIRHLALVAGDPGLPRQLLGDLANLYLESDRADEGRRLFEELNLSRTSSAVGAAWAILAAATDRGDEVVGWLHEVGRGDVEIDPDPETLRNLYFAGADAGQWPLAVAAAELLHDRYPNPESAYFLASGLVETNRPDDALELMRPLIGSNLSADEESVYVAALSGARSSGSPVENELRAYWRGRLQEAEAARAPYRDEEAVFGLLDLRDYAGALSTLRGLAARDGETWLGAYVEASVETGRIGGLIEFLNEDLDREDLSQQDLEMRLFVLLDHQSPAESTEVLGRFAGDFGGEWVGAYKQGLLEAGRVDELLDYIAQRASGPRTEREELVVGASEALDLGAKDLAERILLDLAEDSPPDSPEVFQLLFVWGPRPGAAALDWIHARASDDQRSDRAAWIDLLVDLNSASRAVSSCGSSEPAVLDSCLRALAVAGFGDRFRELVMPHIRAENNETRLGDWGVLSRSLEIPATTDAIYSRLLSLQPGDPDVNRLGGLSAFAISNFPAARQRLERFFSSGSDGDFETNYTMGETLMRAALPDEARSHYQQALIQIDRANDRSYLAAVTRATLLHRLGQVDDSVIAFEALIEARPDDANLRADFASVLLDSDRLEHAGRVLSLR